MARSKKLEERRGRMAEILAELKRLYPTAHCSLNFETPYQLLIATILSAQCTDDRVNKVTPALFERYPDAQAASKAKPADLERLVASTGFFRAKAKSILETSRLLVEHHGGQVPQELESLVKLRGVGRKTANVVLGNAYGIPGMVVDTHVGRLSRRMGMTKASDPVKVEHDLMELVPREDWVLFSHLLICHGRAVCDARKPDCGGCTLANLCPKTGVRAKK